MAVTGVWVAAGRFSAIWAGLVHSAMALNSIVRVPAGTKLTEPPPDEPLAPKTSDDDQDDEA